jgi:hypothetical protein
MAYGEFTLRLLSDRFGITVSDAEKLFADVPPLPVSDFFHILLKRHLPTVREQGTEKVGNRKSAVGDDRRAASGRAAGADRASARHLFRRGNEP